jgi:hypothetical protein
MEHEAAFRLAQEICRLVEDLREEFAMELRADRAKMATFRAGTSGAPEYEYNPPRNWNDTIGEALPGEVAYGSTVGFIGVLWADVLRTHVGRAPLRASSLVDSFVEHHRATLVAWETRGLTDHESTKR